MTNIEKKKVEDLRRSGLGYKAIAKELSLPVSTVQGYIVKHQIPAAPNETCPLCGTRLEHTPGKKRKKFCSDACRMKWWNSHRDLIEPSSKHVYTCRNCGKSLSSYGKLHLYCSFDCYITYRFRKENNDKKSVQFREVIPGKP